MTALMPTLQQWVSFLLARIPGAILTLLGGWVALKIIVALLERALRAAKTEPTIVSLVRSATNAAGWVLILGGVLKALGLNEIAMAVSGSIALIALGIAGAASGTIGDIIAGMFLVSDPDFRVGYTVTAAGVKGVIESIDLRKTRIRGEDGKLHVVPNRSVESATWVVEKRGED